LQFSKFCLYFLSYSEIGHHAEQGFALSVMAGIKCLWEKFREYSPILNWKGFRLKLKGKVV